MPRRADSSRHSLWRNRMDRFRRSGLSAVEFCRREGVSTPSFYRWRAILGRKPSSLSQPSQAPHGFVPIVLKPESIPSPLTVTLPGGASIQVPQPSDPEQLATLLRACVAATAERTEPLP